MLRKIQNRRKGQALVEYGILIGGVAIVCLAAVAILGHKTNDLIAFSAGLLPGAHADDVGPIVSGKLVATTTTTNTEGNIESIVLDPTSPGSLEGNLGLNPGTAEQLVIEPSFAPPTP